MHVPDPSIFLGTDEVNLAIYLGTWVASRNVHFQNLSEGASLQDVNKNQWRMFLNSMAKHIPGAEADARHPTAPDSAGTAPSSRPSPTSLNHSSSQSSLASTSSSLFQQSTSRLPSSSRFAPSIGIAPSVGPSSLSSAHPSSLPSKPPKQQTAAQQDKQKKRRKTNPYLDGLPIRSERLTGVTYFEQSVRLNSVEDLRRTVVPLLPEVLWEIREGGWRLELMALDQALARSRYPSADDDLVASSEARHLGEIFVSEIPTEDRGLASYHWTNRYPYVLALREVVLDWDGCPDTIVNALLAKLEITTLKLENAVAEFYCQSFFSTFGRHPFVPCRLPYRARKRDAAVRAHGDLSYYLYHHLLNEPFSLLDSPRLTLSSVLSPGESALATLPLVRLPNPRWTMSFKAPRGPRLSAATPLRRNWVPARGNSVKAPRRLKKKGLVLVPQVDITVGGRRFTQRRSHRTRRSLSPPSGETTPSIPEQRDRQQIEWERWEKLLTDLIPTYLNLLHDSSNLRSIKRDIPRVCGCSRTRSLSVTVYGMDDMATVRVCPCSAGIQLLQSGYFPSAPLRPTVAFDVKMLEFARELYLRSSPNRSAWTAALESYLRGRGYIVTGVEKTRRKFAKAARYYSLLLAQTEVYVSRRISFLSSVEGGEDDGDWVDAEDDNETAMDYLALCCPMCFGAVAQSDELAPADIVVCIDACFTHKRRKPARGSGKRDPPFRHPRSAFLTDAELHLAKSIVESSRTPAAPPDPAATEDVVEDGMKLPESVLNGCSGSFKAADESQTKASTGFFDDTGLMAVLCRHDRPVFVANVRTAGEQQFYAIGLIIKLFKSIPSHWRVGILYDIGCQLHRSCVKWDFIPDYLDRIIWGVSVFHAYGHQWPCQLVYHPQKCSGFGLSDGEGCERFWSSIQGLISSLRMSGYHQRLLSLDLQIWFLKDSGLFQLASWLNRKWNACMQRKEHAKATLVRIETDFSTEDLQALWDDQVHVQTRPLVSATAGLAKASIRKIVQLKAYKSSLKREISELEDNIDGGDTDTDEAVDKRARLVEKLKTVDLQIRRRNAQLGITDKANLKRLEDNKYLKVSADTTQYLSKVTAFQLRMQARAKKERLQTKLRERRFQLDRSNRVYSQQSASGIHPIHPYPSRIRANLVSERRLEYRIHSTASKHSASIPKTVKDFNTLCDQIQELIRKRHAPRNAKAPEKINLASLYSMDIDSPIWDYQGLDENEDEPPLWLSNDDVRDGIKALLTWQRCQEEECYLAREALLLQTWYHQEWDRVTHAMCMSTGSFKYYLGLQHSRLLELGAHWSCILGKTGLSEYLDDWGPSNDEFLAVLQRRSSTSGTAGASASSDMSQDSEGSDADDSSILSEFEALQLNDSSDSSAELDSGVDSGSDEPPRKRQRGH
ncbi:hypothetical protein NMY22_g8250 [Coprinellus aureogranulatus]|nr:hypothetical protein NMY22_g8250 [Coprinellus aureogranulatus]